MLALLWFASGCAEAGAGAGAEAGSGPVPAASTQMILVVVPDADSSTATLSLAERAPGGPWRPARATVGTLPARVGASGVAWGIGLHPPQPGLQKVEGDWRSPAGVFPLGEAYCDDSACVGPRTDGARPALPSGIAVRWPLRWVGERDLWVEDPTSPRYNEHIVVPGDRPLLPWEDAARMTLGAYSLALKVFIAHNPGPGAVPGAGSAVFLHAGAGPGLDAPTAGCTSIDRADLERVLGWLDPAARPVLVLLTRAELDALAGPWGLPRP